MTLFQSLEPRRLLTGTLTLDQTFGTGGFSNSPAAIAGYTMVVDVDIATNGKSVALAQGNGREVVRYNIDGSVDNSFGVNGRFILNFGAQAVAVERDGSVLVASDNTVLKLTPDGDTDDSFGAGGFVSLTSNGLVIASAAQDIREEQNGSIVLLRSGTTSGAGSAQAVIVTHLQANGDIDTHFFNHNGSNAFVLPLVQAGINIASDYALSPTGDAVYFGGPGLDGLRVVRTNDQGVLDQSYQIDIPFNRQSLVLTSITVSDLGDLLTVSSPVIANAVTVSQFDPAGIQTASSSIILQPSTQQSGQINTAIASNGSTVLVGFRDPYAIARLVSNQIAPGVFLGSDGVLSVDGSTGNDSILINRASTTQLRVTRNGRKTLVDRSDVTQINLNGRDGNDVLTVTVTVPTVALGELGDDTITTGDANDTLSGADGNDSLTGNGGNDLLDAGVGADRLYGGSGKDRMSGGGGKDLMYGGSGDDQMDGGASDDRIFGQSGNDKLFGGRGNDLLDGDGGTNQYFPGDGDDTVLGG